MHFIRHRYEPYPSAIPIMFSMEFFCLPGRLKSALRAMSASSLPSSTCEIGENTSQLKADGSSGSKYSLHTVATNSVEIVFSGCLPQVSYTKSNFVYLIVDDSDASLHWWAETS